MEMLLTNIEWAPVIVSTAVAFGLGWLWYSPVLFLKPWLAGIGESVWQAPMWMPLSAQLGATLLLAVIVNLLIGTNAIALLVLISLTLMGFIKANGLYAGKTKIAIIVEVLYILAAILIMVLVNNIL